MQAERARRSLAYFFRAGWHVLEPTTPLVDNWHVDAVCDHVQATLGDWMRRQGEPDYVQRIRNLLINIPPGTAKSRIVSVFAPAWMWLHWPSWRAIFLSANPRVALRDSVFCRDLLESSWYQTLFRPEWKLRPDQNSKSLYWNTAGGIRSAFGILGRITGDRADALFIDDPHDAQEAESDALRQEVLDKWDSAIRNRVADPATSVRIGIMQRLHEADWSGHVLAKGGWEHLCLPMEHEPSRLADPGENRKDSIPRVTAIGWTDPRTKPGELLFPARFPPDVLAEEKTNLGSRGYAGQHQQRPAPADGDLFKRGWWKFYRQAPEVIAAECEELIQSWDMTFKETKDSDYVVGQVWGRKGADKFLLSQVRARMDFPTTVQSVRTVSAKWPATRAKLVEDKANGPAVIATLKSSVAGLIPVEPDGGKEARAHAVSPDVEAGNVYLPDPEIAPWIEDFLEEVSAFPNGAFDDQVDAMTQALRRFQARRENRVERVQGKTPFRYA